MKTAQLQGRMDVAVGRVGHDPVRDIHVPEASNCHLGRASRSKMTPTPTSLRRRLSHERDGAAASAATAARRHQRLPVHLGHVGDDGARRQRQRIRDETLHSG